MSERRLDIKEAAKLAEELDEIVDKASIIYAALKATGYLPRSVTRLADTIVPLLAAVTESLKVSLKVA